MHASALDQKLDYFLVWGDDSGEAPDFRCHVGHGGALVYAEFFDGFSGIFHNLGQSFAAAHVVEAENFQDEIFGGDVEMLFATDYYFTDSGTFTRTSLVIQALKTSVVPMPNATQPIAPTCGVCESEPMFNWPGNA